MLKKTITYEDYDGNQRTEDFYFNLSKAELTDWLTTSGGYSLDKVMEKLIKTENGKEIMEVFKDLIYRAYGEKSLDGRRFVKSKEVKDNFVETEAYSVLYMELVSDAKKAAEFFNAIMPKEWAEETQKLMDNPENFPESVRQYIPKTEETVPANVTPIG